MDHGLWAIRYEVPAEYRAEYLDWFHHVHISEKLSRPGYLWAAHYALGHDSAGGGYLAFFGGESTHTFLKPSPRQLLTRQSEQTKRFMGMRRQSTACIFAEEIRVEGPDAS